VKVTLKVSEEARDMMRKSPYNFNDSRWAIYQNQALDSAACGHLRFLAVGPRNTYHEPPDRLPDTPQEIGWKYGFVGWVDLETGEVQEELPS